MTPADQSPRERLLAAAVEYVGEHGMGDLSVRALAEALGTSHRMLLYHFGSKEGLLAAVVAEVERRQRDALAELEIAPGTSMREIAWTLWKRYTSPELLPYVRLFFEIYGAALQGRPHAAGLLETLIDPWLEPLTELHRSLGMPAGRARTRARLGLAATRGLLLDLLTTGDRRAADRAMRLQIELYELDLERSRREPDDAR